MSKNNTRKHSTDKLIDNAIEQQNSWKARRRYFARRFLNQVNIFSRKKQEKDTKNTVHTVAGTDFERATRRNTVAAYWFPILCAVLVVLIAVWVMITRINSTPRFVVLQSTGDATNSAIVNVSETRQEFLYEPSFDIVRIDKGGTIVVAGRWLPHQNISVSINGKIVATERTDRNGEFVYSPTRPLKPGNYTVTLIGADTNIRSTDKVFIYISPRDYRNSVSLLITPSGSQILQSPTEFADEDLIVSKIDYLDNGRIVVTGDALPRLRVSLSLDDKYIGFARVSDSKHFGLGADVGKLESGKEYTLAVRLHDGEGKTIKTISHKFIMPQTTGDSDTFYTVRRGDCLWIIARNFMRRGVLFSMIAERNNINNPDLIYPKQLLQIPVEPK